MSFRSRIESIFGALNLSEGVVSPSLLEVDFSDIQKYRASQVLSLAEDGSPTALLMCDLLVSFFEDVGPTCQNMLWKVFVWRETSDPIPMLQSALAPTKTEMGGKTVQLLPDPLWDELFSTGHSPNLSKARMVSASDGKAKEGWAVESRRYSKNPLVALAQAKIEFGDSLGGISDGKRIYSLPSNLVDFPSVYRWASSVEGAEKLRRQHTYSLLKDIKDSYSYYMNVGGSVRELVERKAREVSHFHRMVILPPEFDTSEMAEGIDFSFKGELKIAKFPTVVEYLSNKKKEDTLYLSLTESSLLASKQELGPLREVSFKKTHISDVSVEYKDLKDRTKMTYRRTSWKEDFFPLTYAEEYTKEIMDDSVVLMVEP